ncbi:MAG: NAD-dependent epimerase/dehydratase family protein [bacterium]|nr:NAD-dependent epimerase/dehydratase family protein [bacterium]
MSETKKKISDGVSKQSKLVTGGCGFVGRHLVKNLLAEGSDVWALDNLLTGKHPDTWLQGFARREEKGLVLYEQEGRRLVFIQQDAIDFFRNQLDAEPKITLPNFSEVYHFAAVVGGRAVLIEENPMLVATNHLIDASFFQWAVKNRERIGNILYMSTSVSYPFSLQVRGKHVAMKEEYLNLRGHGNIGLPDTVYGWIKIAGEYMGMLAHERYGLSVVCARGFTGYGGDQNLDYPIPSIAGRAARREDPLTIWGSGDQGRDFIYVDDLISALRVGIKNIHDGSGLNIGLGNITTYKEVARIMAELEGYAPQIKGVPGKAEGPFAVYADTTLLKSFGWQARYTVREGFEKVLEKVKGRRDISPI